MPRPEPSWVTFEIDGRQVRAPEGAMLVDAAKYGDIEIPVFCYEPKLGPPVGACRMCLVEIEGIPKLQTACSTPVKDGMVANTTSDNVKGAQEAVVEFLLVNHPLDCPVCDKGGECPLQDISYGWGGGRSRFVEPKRHFKKPVALSPLVAIDRERCILCYRCVRFSQEVAEDYQLVFLERGDHTFVGTHEGTPYVAPFSGNIVELCPVGALTSTSYRFRARPWDVEGAGSVCSLCPSQCNVEFTVRDDERVLRVMARDNEEVDDGWLCDKGRFGYQAVHSKERLTTPMVRDGGVLVPCSWERALEEAAAGLERAGDATAALAGGETTNEEGWLLQRLVREALGSPHVESRRGAALDAEQARALARPDLSARVSDIDHASAVLVVDADLVEESPILDLRVRKAARRNRVPVVLLTGRPGTLEQNAAAVVRHAAGAGEAALAALTAALGGDEVDDLSSRAGARGEDVRAAAEVLRGSGREAVVLWGERISAGERGRRGVAALLAVARALGLAEGDGGLIEVPSGTNARGLREVGCSSTLGPGLADPAEAGSDAFGIARGLAEGELTALVLLHADPLRTHPHNARWSAGLERATHVVAFTDFLTPELEDHAAVLFPVESYPEREGTLTHPDGRLQRTREAVASPGDVRPAWRTLLELSARLGKPIESAASVATKDLSEAMFAAVPFYGDVTLEEIGGRGVRWQERDSAASAPLAEIPDAPLETPPAIEPGLRLGTAHSLWAGRETEHAEALRFLAPRQRAELSPADARERGIAPGDEVEVRANGTSVRAVAALRSSLPAGTVFLLEGTAEEPANALLEGEAVEVTKA